MTPQDAELTVGQLRWILAHADSDVTFGEALKQFADAERREAAAVEHAALQQRYFDYLSRRQEREREHVQQAADDAKQAAIAAGPISRDNAYLVYKDAADAERVRFEFREPRLDFQEWLDAASPPSTRSAASATCKLTGARPGPRARAARMAMCPRVRFNGFSR